MVMETEVRERGNKSQKATGAEGRETITIDSLMELVYQAGLTEDATIECAISGARILPTDAELAHMVPVAIGGAHHIDNVKWVSKDINRMMGQMSYNEFVELCRAVVRIADANGH